MPAPTLWIASYPRSGNTLLRTILFQCFGLRSGSIYPNDLGGQPALERATGHVERGADGRLPLPDQPIHPIKTHHPPESDADAIYIVRNGRNATESLYEFHGGKHPYRRIIGAKPSLFRRIIRGSKRWSSWSDSLGVWDPLKRPNTLLLRYETLSGDTASCVEQIGAFLKLTPSATAISPRDEVSDGRWIRPANAQRLPLAGDDLALFWKVNAKAMREYGYE